MVCQGNRSINPVCLQDPDLAGPQGAGSAYREAHGTDGWQIPYSCEAKFESKTQLVQCCHCNQFVWTTVKTTVSKRLIVGFARLWRKDWTEKHRERIVKSIHGCPNGCPWKGEYRGCMYSNCHIHKEQRLPRFETHDERVEAQLTSIALRYGNDFY